MRKLILFLTVFFVAIGTQAQNEVNDKTVTLVVSGTGDTKENATKNALRSAIEQAFGTFVSANTQLVNDEIVKDEIVSISSGNIESYQELANNTLSNGNISVTLKAVVSIGKLVKFAQSKGSTAELAGATFMMNIKIKELNKQNEEKAIRQLFLKLMEMSKQNLFDYSMTLKQPKVDTDGYIIGATISISPNQNYQNIVKEFNDILMSLSLNKEQIEDYKLSNINCYDVWINHNKFTFRNDWTGYDEFKRLKECICQSFGAFTILDNLGNHTTRYNIRSFSYLDRYGYHKKPARNFKKWELLPLTNTCEFPIEGKTSAFYLSTLQSKITTPSFLYPLFKMDGVHYYNSEFGANIWVGGDDLNIGGGKSLSLYFLYSSDSLSKITKIEVKPDAFDNIETYEFVGDSEDSKLIKR